MDVIELANVEFDIVDADLCRFSALCLYIFACFNYAFTENATGFACNTRYLGFTATA